MVGLAAYRQELETPMSLQAFTAIPTLSRRQLLGSAAALFGAGLAGCSRAGEQPHLAMTVHRDPSCNCCETWAQQSHAAGFRTSILDESDMTALKRRLGVPADLASCHTAVVNGLIVEGHVPFDQVHRLIRERPQGIAGIAVPGMPAGSPGMEMPDGRREPFQVIAFDRQGRRRVFASVSA